jgi:hypothetical protein
MFTINTDLLRKILPKSDDNIQIICHLSFDVNDCTYGDLSWNKIIEKIINPLVHLFEYYVIEDYFDQGHIVELDKYIFTTSFDVINNYDNWDISIFDKKERLFARHIVVQTKKRFKARYLQDELQNELQNSLQDELQDKLQNELLLHTETPITGNLSNEEMTEQLNKKVSILSNISLLREIDEFECEVLLPHSLSKLYFDIDIKFNHTDTLSKVLMKLTELIHCLFDIKKTDPNYNLVFAISYTDRNKPCSKKSENKLSSYKKESYHILVNGIKINSVRRRKLGFLINRSNKIYNKDNDYGSVYNYLREFIIPESCDQFVYNDFQPFRLLNRTKEDGHYKKPLGYVRVNSPEPSYKDLEVLENIEPKFEDFLITSEGVQSYNNCTLTIDKIIIKEP